MGKQNDPYKLRWRFWLCFLSMCLIGASGVTLLAYYLDEPKARQNVWGWFSTHLITGALWNIGPALATYYYWTSRRLKKNDPK